MKIWEKLAVWMSETGRKPVRYASRVGNLSSQAFFTLRIIFWQRLLYSQYIVTHSG